MIPASTSPITRGWPILRHHASAQAREQHHHEHRKEERDDSVIGGPLEGRRKVLGAAAGAGAVSVRSS